MAVCTSVVMNSAAVSTCADNLFESLLSVLWGVHLGVELPDHVLILLKLVRSCHTDFQTGCAISHCCRQWDKAPDFSACSSALVILWCLFVF